MLASFSAASLANRIFLTERSLHEQHDRRPHTITGHQNLKEIKTYTKAVEQAALAKTAMASVTKAFHKGEVANLDDGLAEIDFRPLGRQVRAGRKHGR